MSDRDRKRTRVLLLGGTSEARHLTSILYGDDRFDVVLSLAGRTAQPDLLEGLPVRIGGFGGAMGLAGFIADEGFGVVVDATHPFAARISANAVEAARHANIALIALERAAWVPQPGDAWQCFASVEDAVAALPKAPQRIFSGLGRLSLAALAAAPQHHYVIRVIDPVLEDLPFPNATVICARGPFKTEDDLILLRSHNVACVLSKNSGGSAAYSKIAAARVLAIPVFMIGRPELAARRAVSSIDEVMSVLSAHHISSP